MEREESVQTSLSPEQGRQAKQNLEKGNAEGLEEIQEFFPPELNLEKGTAKGLKDGLGLFESRGTIQEVQEKDDFIGKIRRFVEDGTTFDRDFARWIKHKNHYFKIEDNLVWKKGDDSEQYLVVP